MVATFGLTVILRFTVLSFVERKGFLPLYVPMRGSLATPFPSYSPDKTCCTRRSKQAKDNVIA